MSHPMEGHGRDPDAELKRRNKRRCAQTFARRLVAELCPNLYETEGGKTDFTDPIWRADFEARLTIMLMGDK